MLLIAHLVEFEALRDDCRVALVLHASVGEVVVSCLVLDRIGEGGLGA